MGHQASFWHFARADLHASYTNHQRTYLDTEDLSIWRRCGLQVRDSGDLYSNYQMIKSSTTQCRQVAQLVSHTLIWLVLRVMNFLASSSTDTLPAARQSTYDDLTSKLDDWHANLPLTFQPCAQVRHVIRPRRKPVAGGLAPASPCAFTEVFYSDKQCAAATQLYHFARIMLLKARSSLLMDSAADTQADTIVQAVEHARSIIGIALGRPHPAVRVEMALPLYIAGTCLVDDAERGVVLEVLKAIEVDTGCSTGMKVRTLVEDWGWPENLNGVS